MKQKTDPSPDLQRCQHRTRSGRQCSSRALDDFRYYCVRHLPEDSDAPHDFAKFLIRHGRGFQDVRGIHKSLAMLYTLLAADAISPRRASVLAYISSLMLRTLPGQASAARYDSPAPEQELQSPLDSASNPPSPLETSSPSSSAGIPPGKNPLPATAAEFADAVLNALNPN